MPYRSRSRRYWYKDPGDIPERHWTRYGLSKPNGSADTGGSAAATGKAEEV